MYAETEGFAPDTKIGPGSEEVHDTAEREAQNKLMHAALDAADQISQLVRSRENTNSASLSAARHAHRRARCCLRTAARFSAGGRALHVRSEW